jgi:hypothetical protein
MTTPNNTTPTSQKPEQITLKPSQGRTIRFRGERIAHASDAWVGGREQTRWTDIRLYRTTGTRYVLWIARCTQWQGEQDEYIAHVCSTPEEVYQHLHEETGNTGDLSRLASLLLHDLVTDPAFATVAIEDIE